MRTFQQAFLALVILAFGSWLFDSRLEAWLAPKTPIKVFIVEEDHTSISGQLNQAELLLRLHFAVGVRDIVLEGYAGRPTPSVYAPSWLPSVAHRAMLDYGFGRFTLADYMPMLATAGSARRFSIALPELVSGNVTAAEFAGAVLPIRLHSGEPVDTYQQRYGSRGQLCDFLARKAYDTAREDVRYSPERFARAYDKALLAGSRIVDGKRRVAGEGQAVLARELIRVLADNDIHWQRAAVAWDEVCDRAASGVVVSIERLLVHYEYADRLVESGTPPQRFSPLSWREDKDFLRARSRASTYLAGRSARLARRLGRPVAVVVGAAHTERLQELLNAEPGVSPVVLALNNSFGQLGEVRFSESDWKQRESLRRIGAPSIAEALLPLRRAPPVVEQPWFQARHELASIADRLIDAATSYQIDRQTSATPDMKGRFASVEGATVEQIARSAAGARAGGSELAGFLVRASVRTYGAEQNLWLIARQSGYLLPEAEASQDLTLDILDRVFDWLRRLTVTEWQRQFSSQTAASGFGLGPNSLIARLSLRARAIVARSREDAIAALRFW